MSNNQSFNNLPNGSKLDSKNNNKKDYVAPTFTKLNINLDTENAAPPSAPPANS